MHPFPPDSPTQELGKSPAPSRGRLRVRSDKYAALFTAANRSSVPGEPLAASQRSERGARIAAEIRRVLFFGLILVAVAFVIVELVSAL